MLKPRVAGHPAGMAGAVGRSALTLLMRLELEPNERRGVAQGRSREIERLKVGVAESMPDAVPDRPALDVAVDRAQVAQPSGVVVDELVLKRQVRQHETRATRPHDASPARVLPP